MTRKHLIEGAVIFGTAQGQHLIAVELIPPGSRALEPHMTNELVGRLDPTATQRIAPSAKLAIVGPIPMVREIVPAIRNRLYCLRLGYPHLLQPDQLLYDLVHVLPT